MKRLGIIGVKLGHSFSKQYFEAKFSNENIEGYSYDVFPMPSLDNFREWLNVNKDITGLSVTIPYKISIIPFLDELDNGAKAIGAVNTIKIINTGGRQILKGYNTDVYGFSESLKKYLQPHHRAALVLGTGGASKAVGYALEKSGIPYQKVSRFKAGDVLTYNDLNEEIIKINTLLINTTPLGMYPDVIGFPQIPYDAISPSHLVFDLIYNPPETMLLKKALAQGAIALNGLEMLHLQAEKAWEIWRDSY